MCNNFLAQLPKFTIDVTSFILTFCFLVLRMPNEIAKLDWNDTFLDLDHLRDSFPSHEVKVRTNDPTKLVPPFM